MRITAMSGRNQKLHAVLYVESESERESARAISVRTLVTVIAEPLLI